MFWSDELSLSDVVKQLRQPDDEDETGRVRNWVQNMVRAKLARPLPIEQRGRGIHYRFDAHEVLKLAALQELTNYGLPVRVLELVSDHFDHIRAKGDPLRRFGGHRPGSRKEQLVKELREQFLDAAAGKRPIYLRISAGYRRPLLAGVRSVVDMARSPYDYATKE